MKVAEATSCKARSSFNNGFPAEESDYKASDALVKSQVVITHAFEIGSNHAGVPPRRTSRPGLDPDLLDALSLILNGKTSATESDLEVAELALNPLLGMRIIRMRGSLVDMVIVRDDSDDKKCILDLRKLGLSDNVSPLNYVITERA